MATRAELKVKLERHQAIFGYHTGVTWIEGVIARNSNKDDGPLEVDAYCELLDKIHQEHLAGKLPKHFRHSLCLLKSCKLIYGLRRETRTPEQLALYAFKNWSKNRDY